MAGSRENILDAIIAYIFRYELIFGLTTHLYDSKKNRLVHSRIAHCYSLSLHVTAVILLLVFYKLSQADAYYTQTDSHFFEKIFLVHVAISFLAIFVSLVLEWTLRANETDLFNEIIQMWKKDVVHLQGSVKISPQAARLFILKTLTSALVVANGCYGTYTMNTFGIVRSVYVLLLSNITIALLYKFSSGLLFSYYIFRILNYNLQRVVEEVNGLCWIRRPPQALRNKLEKDLDKIGRIHAQLQKWVVRFKDQYQVEIALIMLSFFVLQVFTLFILCVVIHNGWIGQMQNNFIAVSFTAISSSLDTIFIIYLCGELLNACNDAGVILKDLPERGLACTRLERCIEMMGLQFKREKLRLRICGLVDLDWSQSFTMMETTLMYIILLIQLDYDDF